MEEPTLTQWNALSSDAAAEALLPCCGSRKWARAMAERRPLHTADALIETAADVWRRLPETDWQEAFHSHPRIGETRAAGHTTAQSAAWSAEEQNAAATPDAATQLACANRRYEQRFARIFLICANGKSAPEILAELQARLGNDPATELRIAAEEQCRITEFRLRRWLTQGVR